MVKTVLITGATAGFGEAAAHKFAENNYRLILTGRRSERLEKLKNPTLILWSEAIGENPFAKILPNAKTIYYKNTRLYPMIETPEQTSKDVLSFLQNI